MTPVEGKRWMRCAYPPYNTLFQLVGRVSAAHPPLAARNRRGRAGKRSAPAICRSARPATPPETTPAAN
ncbi:hypothetical protein EHI92_12515 [Cronobacter sakazakii]|nr:hypothetical protein [Cronobacter sakazakii]